MLGRAGHFRAQTSCRPHLDLYPCCPLDSVFRPGRQIRTRCRMFPLACPFRRLFQPDEAEDQGSFAVPSPSLRRLQLISNRGIWSCTKLRREPTWTPWRHSWNEKTSRFWRHGALRGLLRLGQCLRHVLDTVIDHCTAATFLRRDSLAVFSATHLFFYGHHFHESARRLRAFTGLLIGLEPSLLRKWDHEVLEADACSHWRVTQGT